MFLQYGREEGGSGVRCADGLGARDGGLIFALGVRAYKGQGHGPLLFENWDLLS